jgi:hypothetical protein
MKKMGIVIAVILGLALIQPVQASEVNTIAIIDTAMDVSKNSNVVYEACFTLATCPNGTNFQEGPGSANVSNWKIKGIEHGFNVSRSAVLTNPNIKIVFVTHLLGIPAKVSEYKKYFSNAIFLDDVCESHGCLYENKNKVGSDSTGATFSFYFGHHMSTIEGGIISTNDSELYDLMKLKRSHGLARVSDNFDKHSKSYPDIDKSFLFITDGYNFRKY